MVSSVLSFFFFKQKTAYEVRISDWSSDVCSSDLPDVPVAGDVDGLPAGRAAACRGDGAVPGHRPHRGAGGVGAGGVRRGGGAVRHHDGDRLRAEASRRRSEEHTSELQSLMRISYAVFCLKKNKHTYNMRQSTTRHH